MPIAPLLRRAKKEDCEFKHSLDYIARLFSSSNTPSLDLDAVATCVCV